ncbi:MAG: hypothetical protein KZQ86_20515, partial [Candidatus Thiodiazotropha sp. (ex Lucinoma kastoroae)]|nr:hypothetical protein [Candidatus Thiodiazotropha sp. (ex Lucinoma kastoroae)]
RSDEWQLCPGLGGSLHVVWVQASLEYAYNFTIKNKLPVFSTEKNRQYFFKKHSPMQDTIPSRSPSL